jgi:hypothetical protein
MANAETLHVQLQRGLHRQLSFVIRPLRFLQHSNFVMRHSDNHA